LVAAIGEPSGSRVKPFLNGLASTGVEAKPVEESHSRCPPHWGSSPAARSRWSGAPLEAAHAPRWPTSRFSCATCLRS